jgi:hypothetical protein
MILTTNVALWDKTTVYKTSVGKEAIWKTYCKCGDIIKMYLESVEWACVNWIELIHNANNSGLCENVTLI